ncbi:MAG: antibiotic biosynthesis monooxygenase [Actinobacteria bacterium]|nr:antibiotic biosynthesis monooxygenase [Actinomycetota bacterium]
MTAEAFVTFVHVHVTPGAEDTFLEASRRNASSSRQEAGVTRFDVFQEVEDPTRFVFVEGYVSEDAVAAHKETAHYAGWRAAVDGLMAEQRHSVRFVNR